MSTTGKIKKALKENNLPETAETAGFIFSASSWSRQKYNWELSNLNTPKLQVFKIHQRDLEINREAFTGKISSTLENGVLASELIGKKHIL